MTDHVHEWWGDDQGAVCGADSCEETLSQKEASRRLNATERLLAKGAEVAARELPDAYGPAGDNLARLAEALMAYAAVLEGRE